MASSENSSFLRSLLSSPLRLCVLACLLLVFFSVFALLGMRQSWQRRLEVELERMAAAGEPVSARDLYRHYAPSPDAYAAGEAWLAALAFTQSTAFQAASVETPIFSDDSTLPNPNWFDEGAAMPNVRQTADLLARYAPQIERLHEVVERSERFAFPLKWEDCYAILLEHVQLSRAGARVFQLTALEAIERGDSETATRSLLALLRLAEAIGDEPIMVSQLVRYALDGMACKTLARAASRNALDDADWAGLQAVLAARSYLPEMRSSMLAERALGIEMMHQLGGGLRAEDILGGESTLMNPAFRLAKHANAVHYTEFMSESIALCDLPAKEAYDQLQALEAELDVEANEGLLQRVEYLATRMLTPAISSFVTAAYDRTAESRAAAVGCAAVRWKLAEGDWPASLEQLTERFPELEVSDPWSTGPLQYVVADGGCVIYSVARDGVDDAGVPRDSSSTTYDVPFRIAGTSESSPAGERSTK